LSARSDAFAAAFADAFAEIPPQALAVLAAPGHRLLAEFDLTRTDLQSVALLGALAVALWMVADSLGAAMRERRTRPARGTVIGHPTTQGGIVATAVQFADGAGRRWTVSLPGRRGARPKRIGSPVALIYDPANPRLARKVPPGWARAVRRMAGYAAILTLGGLALG